MNGSEQGPFGRSAPPLNAQRSLKGIRSEETNTIIINKAQNLDRRGYSKSIHTRTQAPAHTSILNIQNFIDTQLKTGSKQRHGTEDDSSTEQKTWQLVYILGKTIDYELYFTSPITGMEIKLRRKDHTPRMPPPTPPPPPQLIYVLFLPDSDQLQHFVDFDAFTACFYSSFPTIHRTLRVQELCESRGGRPGLSILMSFTVSVDVKQH